MDDDDDDDDDGGGSGVGGGVGGGDGGGDGDGGDDDCWWNIGFLLVKATRAPIFVWLKFLSRLSGQQKKDIWAANMWISANKSSDRTW